MIIITQRAIDSVLADGVKLFLQGKNRALQHHMDLYEKTAREKPFLYRYLERGADLTKIPMGDEPQLGGEWSLFRAGYKSGAYLTLRMIERQAKFNKSKLPDIILEDIEKVDSEAERIFTAHQDNAKWVKMAQIKEDNNGAFADYVTKYATQSAPHQMIGDGFVIGSVCTYSAYEQAFGRLEGKITVSN